LHAARRLPHGSFIGCLAAVRAGAFRSCLKVLMAYIWSLLDRWLYGPASTEPDWRGWTLRMLRYATAVVRDLTEDEEISLRAMGLVYTTLLTVVPLVAFLATLLHIFGRQESLEPIIREYFTPLGDAAAVKMTASVMQFVTRASTGVVGSVGFVLLAWTVIGTIKRLEDSFNFLWHIDQARSFARRTMEYLTLLVIGPLLLITFITLSQDAQASAPLQQVVRMPLFDRVLSAGMPYLLVSAVFAALYLLIPNTRVRFRPAVLGGLVAGVLWAAVGKIFTAFVVYSTRTTFIYTGFAFIITALLWNYSSWLILLAGAQLSFYIQNPAYLRLGTRPVTLSASEQEELALEIMYHVSQAHLRGGRLWTLPDLAAELSVPGVALSRLASALTHAGLLLTTTQGLLVPGRDVSQITAAQVLEAARHEGGGSLPVTRQATAVGQLLTTLDDTRRNRLGDLSLRELVEEPRLGVVLTSPQPRVLPRV
jgi:membrane protein